LIAKGAFGDIFSSEDNTIIKLFRRQQVTHNSTEDASDHDVVLRAVWDAECAAYEMLAGRSELARYTPRYFGRLRISDVLNESGESVGEEYLLDCAYRLQRVPGRDVKVGWLQGEAIFPKVDAFLDLLNEIGIRHPYDSSVFVPGVETEFTVIDVATWDAMAELTDPLVLHGRLPNHVRARWGSPGAA
jgi:hypothetical protein